VTRGLEPFKELNSSIEAFDHVVRARPRGRQPQRPDKRYRWRTLLPPALIVGLVLLAAMLYLGRGERVTPQTPSGDRAGPAAATDSTGAESQTAGGREQAAGDARRTSAGADGPVESVDSRTPSRPEMFDRDSMAVTGTDVAVEDADADVTTNGSNRSVESDEREAETGAAALDRQEGDYATQVAAFDQRRWARVLADRLAAVGYPAYVVEGDADQAVFRVRIGPYPDRRAAEAVGRRVQEEEALDWYVVTHR